MSSKPKPKPKPKSSIDVPKRDISPKVETRIEDRRNICCRFCGLTSGYLPGEENCRYCHKKIFVVDTI